MSTIAGSILMVHLWVIVNVAIILDNVCLLLSIVLIFFINYSVFSGDVPNRLLTIAS